MSRRYSALERQLVLQRLAANAYDIRITSQQTQVAERTLFRWHTQSLKSLPPLLPQLQEKASLATPTQIPPLAESEWQALKDIKRQLMEKVNLITHSMDQAIDDAPLVQRAASLSHLIDRIIKISALMPDEPEILEGEDFTLEDIENWQP